MGAIFGGFSFSSWSSAQSICPGHVNCPSTATSDRNSAVTFSTISDVGLIAGAVLVAAGVTIYLTAPSDKSPPVGLQVTPGGASLVGRF